jgi:S-adenosylmethionine/arginine decarboxylase-like enzyme
MNNFKIITNIYSSVVDAIKSVFTILLNPIISVVGDNYTRVFGYNKHRGNHVFADFIWDVKKDNMDDTILAETIFKIMRDCIKKTKMKIVHEKLVILGVDENDDTPPGMTSIFLLNESHASSHSYSQLGLLSLDIYTCGETDPLPVMNDIVKEITKHFPTLTCTYKKKHKRFHYR